MKPIEYFSDGISKVDYIIAVTRIAARKHVTVITDLVNSLRELGLEIEQNLGVTESVVFLKIHIPTETVTFLSQMNLSWEATKRVKTPKPRRNWWNDVFKTPLAYVNPNKGMDYCGRIYYIAQIMTKAQWGPKETDHGIDQLISKRVIQKAYPLHDGPVQDLDLDDKYLNDRSLLAKYWASFRYFYKEQPLDIIKKYYGLPTAFYFAWMGFYVQMLIPISIMSAVSLLMCLKRWYDKADDYIKECEQLDYKICRFCVPEDNTCITTNIKSHCFLMSVALVVDDKESMIYSVLVSFWAGAVQTMWMKREQDLRKRWNLLNSDSYSLSPRFQFWEKVS
ncbi:anoctamin-1-like [Aethina tumida]|uniref:anoctamin-1-like n=1 Tax=Aethina tumida TaxID=116153 RepID=UPI002148CA7F|nr:anoctamin-1-like [Aethina tumida]